jgi:hypothetical protein
MFEFDAVWLGGQDPRHEDGDALLSNAKVNRATSGVGLFFELYPTQLPHLVLRYIRGASLRRQAYTTALFAKIVDEYEAKYSSMRIREVPA